MEIIPVFLVFILLIIISLQDIAGNKKWSQVLKGKWVALLIILWSFLGFLLGMHYSTFIDFNHSFESAADNGWEQKNIIFTAIPTIFYSFYFLIDETSSRGIFCFLEIVIFLTVYLALKGDYTWGFMPVSYYMMYDFVAIFLRLFVVLKFLGLNKHSLSFTYFLTFVVINTKDVPAFHGCFG